MGETKTRIKYGNGYFNDKYPTRMTLPKDNALKFEKSYFSK